MDFRFTLHAAGLVLNVRFDPRTVARGKLDPLQRLHSRF